MKKTKIKKLAAGLLAVMTASVVLSGCAEKKNKETTNGGEIQIDFPCIWVGTDSKAEVFGKMVESFNEAYDGKYQINIEEQTDYKLYRDKIRTMISTGEAPDIFTLDTMADLKLFSSSGKLMDMTEFLNSENMSGRFMDGIIDEAAIDGVNYAIPYEIGLIPIMFNERLLEEAGIEEIPQSYEEFWKACEKLKGIGIYPAVQQTKDPSWISMLWYSYALAACGGPDIYEKGLDDPAFVTAAELLKKMFDYTASDALGGDATMANGHFFNERAAIYTNGSWILGRIQKEGVEGLYDHLAVSPGLSYNNKNGGGYVSSVQAYIVAGKQDDENKQAAVEAFFEYITDTERVLELTNSSGSVFSVNIDDNKVTDKVQSEIIKQSKKAQFTVGTFQSEVETAVMTAFPPALEAMVLGDITPEEFVEQLKAADK